MSFEKSLIFRLFSTFRERGYAFVPYLAAIGLVFVALSYARTACAAQIATHHRSSSAACPIREIRAAASHDRDSDESVDHGGDDVVELTDSVRPLAKSVFRAAPGEGIAHRPPSTLRERHLALLGDARGHQSPFAQITREHGLRARSHAEHMVFLN